MTTYIELLAAKRRVHVNGNIFLYCLGFERAEVAVMVSLMFNMKTNPQEISRIAKYMKQETG